MATKQRYKVQGSGKGLPGRPTVYPGKRRDRPVQVALTDEGLDALDRGVERTGYSKANYIEKLLREADARAARLDTRRTGRTARRDEQAAASA